MDDFRIVIPRIIICPNCKNFNPEFPMDPSLSRGENIVKHLFEHCLKKKEGTQHKVIKWILNYFRDRSMVQRDRTNSYNYPVTKKLLDQKYDLEFIEAQVPKLGQCPVCNEMFNNTETCFYHLLNYCSISTEKPKDFAVYYFLKNYFEENSRSLMTFCIMYGALSNTESICKYCFEDVEAKEKLREHYELRHADPLVFDGVICFICNFIAKDENTHEDHIFHEHKFKGSKNGIRCGVCDSVLKTEKAFRYHIRDCTPPKKKLGIDSSIIYECCDVCNLKILITDLDKHLKAHSDEIRLSPAKHSKPDEIDINVLRNCKELSKQDREKLENFLKMQKYPAKMRR